MAGAAITKPKLTRCIMSMEDFQEKMDQNHRTYLCRMLGLKELPDFLLDRYVQLKRMIDRIDAHLTPCDLALLAIIAGVEELTCQVEPPVEAPVMTGAEAAAEVAGGAKPVEPPAKDEKLWSLGMPVNVLAEDELKEGKIVGIMPPAEGKPVQLTVEFEDGDVATVDEDEVEAV